MGIIKKFVPYDAYKDIYCIDYNKLYSEGMKIILFDLDNTISRYQDIEPTEEAINLIKKLKEIGFKVYILSNNNAERIEKTVKKLDILGFSKAKKPLKSGYKKIIKYLREKESLKGPEEIVSIGDQVLTDVFGSNRMKIKSILVVPIHRGTEKWYTKLNRNTESFIINRMKRKHKNIYIKIKEARGENIER